MAPLEPPVEADKLGGPHGLAREAYSPAEVAQLLGMSQNTIYSLARRGELPTKRVGGRILIPRRLLLRWLSER